MTFLELLGISDVSKLDKLSEIAHQLDLTDSIRAYYSDFNFCCDDDERAETFEVFFTKGLEHEIIYKYIETLAKTKTKSIDPKLDPAPLEEFLGDFYLNHLEDTEDMYIKDGLTHLSVKDFLEEAEKLVAADFENAVDYFHMNVIFNEILGEDDYYLCYYYEESLKECCDKVMQKRPDLKNKLDKIKLIFEKVNK